MHVLRIDAGLGGPVALSFLCTFACFFLSTDSICCTFSLCMCVYVYIHASIYTHVCISICTYMYIYIHKDVHVYVYIEMYTHVYVCICRDVHVCTHTYIEKKKSSAV